MIEIDITRNDGETFADFHQRARTTRALAEQDAQLTRNDRLAEILRVARYQIRRIIDLTADDRHDPATGAYVIEYRFDKRDQNSEYYFAAIVNGKHAGRTAFQTRAQATLHALAHLDGDSVDDGHGQASLFAARVLNIPTDHNED